MHKEPRSIVHPPQGTKWTQTNQALCFPTYQALTTTGIKSIDRRNHYKVKTPNFKYHQGTTTIMGWQSLAIKMVTRN